MRVSFCAVFLNLMLAAMFSPVQAETSDDKLICHFDFKNAQDKKEITDTTGKQKCISKTCNFVVQDEALRIDSGASICIPADKFPSIEKEFSISFWVVKGYFGDIAPLFFKGIHPEPIQFLISISGESPEFCYKNVLSQSFWKGIVTSGTVHGGSFTYSGPTSLIKGTKAQVRSGFWTHLTYVFDNGNIKIYNNGVLTIEHKSLKPEFLKNNGFPIYLGAERIPGEDINYRTANILINDIRMYNKSLSDQEAGVLYESEKVKYSKNSYLASNAFLLAKDIYSLPPCNTYLSAMFKDYDPDFKKKLKIVEKYEQNIPADPYISSKITSSKVAVINGQTGLFINDKQEYPILANPFLCQDNKFILDGMKNYVRDFAAADVNLVSTGFISPIPTFWLDDGKYNWDVFDSVFETAIKANPQAQIMANIFLRPPTWFFQKYPDEMEKYYATEKDLKTFLIAAPFSSEKWLEVAKKMLSDSIKHIEESKYSNHVYAYMLSCGDAGEWYWAGSFTGGMPGYSKATKESFQKWLKNKYKNDITLLQAAWNNNTVTFETAEVPSPKFRSETEFFLFRDRKKAGQVFDFREYMNNITLHNIIESCKTIKEASAFKKAVYIYYGYPLLYAGGKGSTLYKGGLQNLSAVMESPYIDCIATPLDYVKRRGGETGLNINPFYASAKLHKKMIWQENDLRSHFHTKLEFGRTANLQETITVIQRGFGMSLVNGAGFWLMPFDNAWYHQENIMENVANIKKAADDSLKVKDKSSVSQVAIIFDEKSPDFTGIVKNNTFIDGHCWDTYQEASRAGAPFDMYLLKDISNSRMPDYKLYIFMNTYYTDKATKDAINAKVRKNNAVTVWCYAPGYITDSGFDVKTMQELTGIEIAEEKEQKTLALEVTDKNNPITKYIKKTNQYTFGPVFNVTDKNVKVLGTAEGKPVFVIKDFQSWKSVYTLMPLNKEMLKGLMEYAGVHVYSRSNDVLLSNKSYIMLHTSTEGDKTITLPGKYNVKEILTGKEIGKGVSEFTEKLPAQSTRIYYLYN